MIHKLSRYMMTLVLLVTAATGAWADNLYVEIAPSGKSATIYWGNPGTNTRYMQDTGFSVNAEFVVDAVKTIETLDIDESCKNHTLTYLTNLFQEWQALTTINNIENLKTAGVKSMNRMFYLCSSLKTLDLTSFNTESVTAMSSMFYSCSALQTVDLSSFNTENVQYMNAMFVGCSSLQTVNLSSFNTAKVQNMSYMFSDCSNLENIYVGDGWNTAAVTNGRDMFAGCSKLPNWNGTVIHAMAKLTDDGGYLQTKPLDLTWNATAGTWDLDEMPEGNVEVEVEYMSLAGITLSVNGTGGTARLLDQTFEELSPETKLMEGQRFVLYVEKPDDYDFKTAFSVGGTSKDFMTMFTKEEYQAYADFCMANDIPVPSNAVMKWVTMPDTDDEDLTLSVTFEQQKPFTLLYQPEVAATEVWARFGVNQNGEETFGYAQMMQSSQMGDKAVWSMKLLSAFNPTKVAFFGSEAEAANSAAAMTAATVSQSDNWNTISGGKYLIIGGNATTVVAAFVADASSVPFYDSEAANISYNRENPGVTYQLVVCPVDNGNVSPTYVYMPEAPAAPEGKQFARWRTLAGTAPDKMEYTLDLGTGFGISENTTFTAVWKPMQVTTTFALNGGTGVSSTVTKDYQDKLTDIAKPTRGGFAFDKWKVAKAVSENGKFFGKGSTFDLSTPLTSNLSLSATWKHVHEYVSYKIEDFGDALADYMKYNGALHIGVCNCYEIEIVAHEFNKAGRCACGYVKPGAQPVKLNYSFGQWSNGTYTKKAEGFPEDYKRGEEATVEAPHNWGDLEFKTWQYSTDGGRTWDELAAFEIVGFLIPCDITLRALYVNPVSEPTVELTSSEYLEPVEYNGQTYNMGNILYQMNYKLPDGFTFVDAGIRMGDNDGISYYEQKERTYSYDAEAKAIAISMLAVVSVLNGEPTTADMSATEKYWANRENSVLDEFSAEKLARFMMDSKPVNVDKYDPIYWQAAAQTKGQTGSVATLPPTRFAQKNNQDHYIYGVGYLRFKTPGGNEMTLYTDAIAATVNNPNGYQVKTLESSARQTSFDFESDFDETAAAARKAPKRIPAQEAEKIDMSTVTAPQTQLNVYVDGEYNGSLSDTYGYGETVTVMAPDVQGKTFSYWTAAGAVVSTYEKLTLTMNANTTLYAVYDADAVEKPAAAITSMTRSNDGQKIVLQGIANGTVDAAGFVYSLTSVRPVIDGDDVTKAEAVSYIDLTDEMPVSVLDKNNCWTLSFAPDDEDAIYHVRAYVRNGGDVSYSDVMNVKLSTLKSGVMMVANLEAFENGEETTITDLLTKLRDNDAFEAGYELSLAASSEEHGTVAFSVDDVTVGYAKANSEVTVTIVPHEGYVVDAISADTYTYWSARRRSPATNNIPVLGDVALTPVDGEANTWTFTMPDANVEVTVRYAKAYEVNVRAGGFATFYTDENIMLEGKTPEGVTLHTITSVTETEAVVGTPLEGIVAANTPLLVYNGTDADETVRIICTAEDATDVVNWAPEFKGTAEGRTFTADDMKAADYYALSGSKVFVKVPGAGTLAPHKCWLQFDKQVGPGARQINIVFGEETGISEEVIVKSEESAPATYTIDGRKVTAPTKKGVYIQNGRKVVVK